MRTQVIPINCPACGTQGQATVVQSINDLMGPRFKEMLFSGELLRWTCASCQQSKLLSYPILYHDMSLMVMIQLFPYPEFTPEGVTAALGTPRSAFPPEMRDYRFRIVRSVEDLIEKCTIFACGLDDRAIELVKAGIVGNQANCPDPQIAQLLTAPEGQPRLMRIDGEVPDQHMVFAYPALEKALQQVPGGSPFPRGSVSVQTPMAEYKKAVSALKDIPPPRALYGSFLHIDRQHLSDDPGAVAALLPQSPASAPGQISQLPTGARPWWKFW